MYGCEYIFTLHNYICMENLLENWLTGSLCMTPSKQNERADSQLTIHCKCLVLVPKCPKAFDPDVMRMRQIKVQKLQMKIFNG